MFEFLKDKLTEIGLGIHEMIGSCTDGASSMYSELVGLSSYLQRENEKHIYVWCVAHRFNLAVEPAVMKIDENIHSIINSLNKFSTFIRASPMRMTTWTNVILNLHLKYKNINTRIRPVADCDTRWWAKYKMISQLVKNENHYVAVLITLRNIKENPILSSKQKKVLLICFIL